MHSSGSFLRTVIELVRFKMEEPVAKITDDVLTRLFIAEAWSETFSLLKLDSDSLPIVRTSVTLVAGTNRYLIPPWCEMVLRLVIRDSNGMVIRDWVPSDIMDTYPGWRIEGNEIVFEPLPATSTITPWELWSVPSGDICLHLGTGAVIGPSTIKLAATPTLGLLDRRPNAYAGQVLRIIHEGRAWQERIIGSYDTTTRRATVLTPFEQGTGLLPPDAVEEAPNVTYEIAPLGWRSLWTAVSWKVCMKIGAMRNVELKQMTFFDLEYQRARKSVIDRAQVNHRLVKHLQRRTVDNAAIWDISAWSFDAQS